MPQGEEHHEEHSKGREHVETAVAEAKIEKTKEEQPKSQN